jgi:hypothetical protein
MHESLSSLSPLIIAGQGFSRLEQFTNEISHIRMIEPAFRVLSRDGFEGGGDGVQ